MIKSIEAKYFRKHEDLRIDFTKGLNVLRGANEVGKTTVTEIILYSLFGASVLVDKFEEVVSWGQKESALKAKMIVCISGVDYTFARSKAGAEVNYTANGQAIKVVGQKEVSSFAAALLGADAKTASLLMLSSQAGLRGALEEGATAVGALMAKLADFDTIDKLLETAAQTLALGSVVPLQTKLAEADATVIEATAALVDPKVLADLELKVAEALGLSIKANDSVTLRADAVDKATLALNTATLNNDAHTQAHHAVTLLVAAVEQEKALLAAATADSLKRPDALAVAAARAQLVDADNHVAHLNLYSTFQAIPAYPEVSWDEPQDSFEATLAESVATRDTILLKQRELTSDIASAKRQIISGDGKCPTCGTVAANHDHVTTANAAVTASIAAFQAALVTHTAPLAEATETIAALHGVRAFAVKRQTYIDRCGTRLTLDLSCYPMKVLWDGAVPESTSNAPALRKQIDAFEVQERSANQAEGRASAHSTALTTRTTALAAAQTTASLMILTPVPPLDAAYDVAYSAYMEQVTLARDADFHLTQVRSEHGEILRISQGAAERLADARKWVAAYVLDIKTLEFNNELVKKLKSMKPQITDFLWNNVLAAVGNYFSVLRGEQSIVTKDATGFRVNGRGGSLSGSTLDMLALAIRVALSKTFVPHCSFVVLDEPAHGCDEVRAGALLGFLSGVGFEQTILASHDELSESVADNVINLGVAA